MSQPAPLDHRETREEIEVAMPRVLFLYYSYTQQSLKVVEAMASVLRQRGCEVREARIEFTDERWAQRFTRFPLRHAILDVLGMLPAQVRGATGEIEVPDEALDGDYDLVCVGSPTWFFKPSVPIRSYLESEAAGRILSGKRFTTFVVCRRYWSANLTLRMAIPAHDGWSWRCHER